MLHNADISATALPEDLLDFGDLELMRQRIRELDARLIALVAERIDLCLEVGRRKQARRMPVRNRQVENIVFQNARRTAGRCGMDPSFAEELMRTIIDHSVRVQTMARERTASDAREEGEQ